MLRRLVVTALATAATAALATASPATAAPLPLPSLPLLGGQDQEPAPDHLTVEVAHNGETDGRYELECHPAGGNHPQILQACDRLEKLTRWGKDPFAPVSPDARCTMIDGGDATAWVTGTWAGRRVEAKYTLHNGCEISRWRTMVPVLPGPR